MSASSKHWYVVHAFSGSEKFVKDALERVIQVKSATEPEIKDKFGEILVPTEQVMEMRGGKKHRTERKFYPGYVFVEMVMDDDTWHLVRSIDNVMGFVGGSKARPDRPAPIPEKEVAAIRSRIQLGDEAPQPKVRFETGEVVRVVDGPFKDFNGVVEEVNYDKSRLRVAVLIFGRSTPVELEFRQVEKA